MVINTRYKFVFVHIPKAAGTSIMKGLNQLRGNHRRWLAKTKHETLAGLYAEVGKRKSLLDRLLHRGPEQYFTFGFVRNPWDRMSSFYRYLVESRPRSEIERVASFKDFLVQARDGVDWIQGLHSMRPQLDYFTLAGETMKIDFLGHYEFLTEDLNTIASQLGCSIPLEHFNQSSNTRRDYRSEYDDEMVEIVQQRFSEEIELFGYEYEVSSPGRRCSAGLHGRRACASPSLPAAAA